jgi:tRNA(fMet)-specific endonuclease VapC
MANPRYLLDTNICIYLIKSQPTSVMERFARCMVGDVVMSAITHAELQYGALASSQPAVARRAIASLIEDIPVVPFDADCGHAYAGVRAATKRATQDHLDKLIAAQALAHDLTLVTNNTRDFKRYPGLRIENWVE